MLSPQNQYISNNFLDILNDVLNSKNLLLPHSNIDPLIYNKLYSIINYFIYDNYHAYDECLESLMDKLYEFFIKEKAIKPAQYFVYYHLVKNINYEIVFDCLDEKLSIDLIIKAILNPCSYLATPIHFNEWMVSIKETYPQYSDQIDKVILLK
jgi:hypothetical protein